MSRLPLALVLAAALATPGCASDSDRENLGIETYLDNALILVDGGHYDQALLMFRRVLEIEPENRKARLGEVTTLYWIGTRETPDAGAA